METLNNLRREADWVHHLLESIVEGIVTCNQEGQVTFFNRGAERILGVSREQVIGQPLQTVFRLAAPHSSEHDLIPPAGARRKILVDTADGRQLTLSITGAELPAPKGESPKGGPSEGGPLESGEGELAFVFHDVTEEETVHRLLGQFMANISHEFRTPLAALEASIELLIDQPCSPSDAQTDALLKSLHLGILGLQTLVDNLLESASIEAGHFRLSLRPCEVEQIIQQAVSTMLPLLHKYGQEIVVAMPASAMPASAMPAPGESLPLVYADARRTEQVLVNLLSNASRYGPQESEIKISVEVHEGWLEVSVADHGPGIPESQRKDIFRRFVYPVQTRNDHKLGAGLGLSVVKAVIEGSGGQVGVEDNPEGGAIFWFTLLKAVDL